MKNEIIINPKEYGLDEKQAIEVESNFLPVEVDKENYAKIYETIVSKEISKETITEARELRLKLVKVRTKTCDIHKVAKAFYLAGGRFVDALKNKNVTVIEQMEEKLSSIENHFENLEKVRIQNLTFDRQELLRPYLTEDLFPHGSGLMDDNVFNNYLAGLKIAHETRIENEKKLEEERLAKIEADRLEQIRVKEENEKLKEEARAKEKELAKVKAKQEAEKKKQDKILADQKAKQELELKKQREESEKKLQLEREAKEKIEKELKAKQEAENKRLAEVELKKKQEAEANAKAERQPDKQKLLILSTFISQKIEMPEVKSKEAKQIVRDVQELLNKVSTFINQKTEKL